MKIPMVDTVIYWAGVAAFILVFTFGADVFTFEAATTGVLAVLFMRGFQE